MRRRSRFLSSVVLALGALAGAIAYRRWFSRAEERVDVYYEDGSMVSLTEGSSDAERLLPLARDVLDAARS